MKQTAVEWLVANLDIDLVDSDWYIEKAKEMELEYSENLLEWIRENTFEIPNGWQYLGVTLSDKQLIEKYNETFNK